MNISNDAIKLDKNIKTCPFLLSKSFCEGVKWLTSRKNLVSTSYQPRFALVPIRE